MTLFNGTYRIESARLAGWDYRSPGWYFVTLCTKDFRHDFGEISCGQMNLSPVGEIARTELARITIHYSTVRLDEFVVMPNHVHAILILEGPHQYSPPPVIAKFQNRLLSRASTKLTAGSELPSLANIVGGYKSGVGRLCHNKGFAEFAWQPRFYDHVLRGNAAVNAVRAYIVRNPENWDKDEDNRGPRESPRTGPRR